MPSPPPSPTARICFSIARSTFRQISAQRDAEIQRGIAVASAYFEDKLGTRPRRLYYAGIQDIAEFAASIGDPELSVVEWASRPAEGAMTTLPQTSFAGVAGALAGAS